MSPSVTRPHSLASLDSHLSAECKARTPSAMKALGKLMMGTPGIVSLAGGMPHQSLFPLSHAKFTIPHPSTLGSVDSWAAGIAETKDFELFKGQEGGVIDLSRGLQYGLSNGFEELIEPISELMKLVHNSPISDSTVVLTLGCTDGVAKTWTLFCERGDNVLCEEFTFSNSLNSGRSRGITFHGVEVDGQGMIPESLDRIMTEWDVSLKGKKPSLVYTIPVGQNPTGSCPPAERYDAIYALCQKHDLIIMEDDPYFWLQFQEYTSDLVARKAGHDACVLPPPVSDPLEDDIEGVVEAFNRYANIKSFLSRDIDGRVVRLDTFSKIMFPGSRTGWVTCNSSFAERYLRVGETNTQVPNGIGQSVLASYLSPNHGWGVSGFLRWIFSVRIEYERKRDFFVDNLTRFCKPEYATTVPALGGMFQWLEIHLEKHPRFTTISPAPTEGPATNTAELVQELFEFFLAKQLLILPGTLFAALVPGLPNASGVKNIHDRSNFFRATFAGNTEQIEKALEIFGTALEEFFQK